ncbi:tape measure protein [Cupriavidus sp. amp6]|uniref:tape measure protein n=1 Tax=Cupriavidus sp. amp6 TaxID=388051 RepID=UPI000411EAB0|nr:tape measure protein [Cupriavidus sp. amp6]
MNAIRELVTVLKYEVDNSGLSRYQAAFRNGMAKLRAGARNVREFGAGFMEGAHEGLRDVLGSQQALNTSQANGAESVERMGRGYRSIAGVVRSLVAGFSVVQAARVADEWASVEGRVGLATKSVEEQKYALQEIYGIAQRTRQEYTATGDLFQKVQRNASDLGLGLSDSLNLTEIIGKTMTIGGGDTGAQQAALMQLGQALGAGALRGDELNSIIEQAPRLAESIADAFGVSVGQLKDLGKAGKLTSKELAQGLLKQADKIGAEFDRMPKTFGGSMVLLKNALGRQISALNKATGAANQFAAAAAWVADNLTDVLKVLVLISASMAIVQMGRALNAAAAAAGSLRAMLIRMATAAWASLGPYLAIAAALGAIYLIGQDIWVWLQGGDSVLGSIVGGVEEWGGALNGIIAPLRVIWEAVQSIWARFGQWITSLGNWIAQALGLGSIFENWEDVAKAVFSAILSYIGTVLSVISSLISAVAAAFRGDWDAASFHLQEVFRKWWEWLKAIGDFAATIFKAMGDAIATWVITKVQALKGMLANLMPDWVKNAGAWVGNKVFGKGAADVQRVVPGGGVTIQNNIGGVQVTAPNSSPAAIAAATERGISTAVSPGRMSRAAAAVPMVEAGA